MPADSQMFYRTFDLNQTRIIVNDPLKKQQQLYTFMGAEQLRVEGLTALQVAELRTVLGESNQTCMTEEVPRDLSGGKHGEPVLLTVALTLAPAVISAVALWLSKQKQGRMQRVRYYKKKANGDVQRLDMDLAVYKEGGADAGAVETLLKGVLHAART